MSDLGRITALDPLLRGFTMLDATITDSSIWVQPHDVLRVWIYILSKCDKEGRLRVSTAAMSQSCMVTRERLTEILSYLSAPDPDSRTSAFEGRRIEMVEGGLVVLNYRAWRQIRSQQAAANRQQNYRDRKRAKESRG